METSPKIGIFSIGDCDLIKHYLLQKLDLHNLHFELVCYPLQLIDLKHSYDPPAGLVAAILVHPPVMRLSLTDVPDALYEYFLPIVSRVYGPGAVCIVAYGLDSLHDSTYDLHLETLARDQHKATELAETIILLRKLEDMPSRQRNDVRKFISKALECPKELPKHKNLQDHDASGSYSASSSKDMAEQNVTMVTKKPEGETGYNMNTCEQQANDYKHPCVLLLGNLILPCMELETATQLIAKEIKEALLKISSEYGLNFIDNADEDPKLCVGPDGVHLNEEGVRTMSVNLISHHSRRVCQLYSQKFRRLKQGVDESNKLLHESMGESQCRKPNDEKSNYLPAESKLPLQDQLGLQHNSTANINNKREKGLPVAYPAVGKLFRICNVMIYLILLLLIFISFYSVLNRNKYIVYNI